MIPPFAAGMPVAVPASVLAANREDEAETSRWMDRLAWMAEEIGVSCRTMMVPADLPLAEKVATTAAKEKADLVVTGTKEKGMMERIVFGSVSSDIVRKAACPVLVVH
jgi:nucleotide-binding universal stress UspA family protein